jgi:Flp pilus assembly pilin Flp
VAKRRRRVAFPMRIRVLQLIFDDEGQDLIEYGLLIGIVTLASVLAITSIGGKVKAYFAGLNTAMP